MMGDTFSKNKKVSLQTFHCQGGTAMQSYLDNTPLILCL